MIFRQNIDCVSLLKKGYRSDVVNKVRKYFNKYELETMLRFVLKYKKAIVNIYIIDKGIGRVKLE